jgi:hypothetical protein
MNDPLEVLLPHVDAARPLVSAEEVATWPADTLRRLMAAGLIRLAESAAYVACPNCHEAHDAEVTVRDGPGGRLRFFIHCPEALANPISREIRGMLGVGYPALLSRNLNRILKCVINRPLNGTPEAPVSSPWQGRRIDCRPRNMESGSSGDNASARGSLS